MEPLAYLTPYLVGIPKAPAEMTRTEAKAEFAEFQVRRSDLLRYIETVLRGDGVDLSPPHDQALERVDDWLASRGRRESWRISTVLRRDERDLSVPTLSACCYVGLLFGDRLTQDVSGTHWALDTGDRQAFDYHRAVVRSASGKVQVEPINVTMNILRGRMGKISSERTLGSVYRLWRDTLAG